MSSHHFVKEGQEPVLLILSIAPSSFEQAQTLLEWSPGIFVADTALETVLKWNIKIDGVMVPQSQKQKWTEVLKGQYPLAVVEHADGLLLQGLTQLILTSNHNLQLVDDEEVLSLQDLETITSASITVLRHGIRWSLIRAEKWSKWLPAGSTIQLVCGSNLSTQIMSSDGPYSVQLPPPFWVGEAV